MRTFVHGLKKDISIFHLCEHMISDDIRKRNLQNLPSLLNSREIAAAFVYYLERKPALIVDFIKKS